MTSRQTMLLAAIGGWWIALVAGQLSAQQPAFPAYSYDAGLDEQATPAAPGGAGSAPNSGASPAGSNCCGSCSCCCPCREELAPCDTIIESIFGQADPNCWRPLTLSSLFSEGWNEAWVPSPAGSGGAPRQGWINAADGNMYRLNFLTFAQGFNSPSQGTAYVGAYTLYTPLSRRLLLITNVPYVLRNNISEGLPVISPNPQPGSTTHGQTSFGDVSFTPRVLLHETKDFSLTTELAITTPTGNQPLAGKTSLTPNVSFWSNVSGGWVVRGGIGVTLPTGGTGDVLVSQLAIGQTITDHNTPLFGDFTYYVSAVASSPLSGGQTSVSLTPGMRTHVGNDWYFLAGLPTPVTKARVADLGMIFWFMKAW